MCDNMQIGGETDDVKAGNHVYIMELLNHLIVIVATGKSPAIFNHAMELVSVGILLISFLCYSACILWWRKMNHYICHYCYSALRSALH